jgi:hypothetical protein
MRTSEGKERRWVLPKGVLLGDGGVKGGELGEIELA